MARKNREDGEDDVKQKDQKKRSSNNLREETVGWIAAVVLFAAAIFFVLASLDKAGLAGAQIFKLLSRLFGVGYFLIPAICLAMSISFARSFVRPVSKMQYLGAFIFFISSLALVDLSLRGRGGIIGGVISGPLLKLFDVYASFIILLAL